MSNFKEQSSTFASASLNMPSEWAVRRDTNAQCAGLGHFRAASRPTLLRLPDP
jgi:hypothetical protein